MKTLFGSILAALFVVALAANGCAQTLLPFVSGTPAPNVVFPAANNVMANWQNAGMLSVGGIPTRSTQCGATRNPRGGGLDDTPNINGDIAACPSGQVVQLGAGTFNIPMSDMIHLNKGITLRGFDACPATLSVTAGEYNALCATILSQSNGLTHVNGTETCSGGTCSGAPVILMAPAAITDMFGFSWSDCQRATSYVDSTCGGVVVGLTADAAKGDTTVFVNTTSPFTVGMWVLITEASGALWQADPVNHNFDGGVTRTMVWSAPDAFSTSPTPVSARNVWAQYSPYPSYGDFDTTTYPYTASSLGCGGWSYCDRATQEIHKITVIGAGPCPCAVTLDDGLTVAYRQSGGAQFTGYTTAGQLHVVTLISGTITTRAPLTDINSAINGGTYIISQASGVTGGVGVYNIPGSQTLASSGAPIAMAAGGYAAKILYPTSANSGGSPTAVAFLEMAGIENLSIQRGNGGNVLVGMCATCWVKNVDSSWMANGAVEVTMSARVEINGVFGRDCWNNVNAGGEYPFDFSWGATEILLTNSISRACGKGMTARAGGAGSVVSYNYIDDQYYGSGSTLNYWLIDAGCDASHFTGPHHVLFEQDWCVNFLNDHVHGNAGYHTYFRNFGAGYRTPFTDNQTGTSVNDFTNTGEGASIDALRVAVPTSYHYNYAFVGNVLGTAGSSTTGNGWTYQTGTGAQSGINIWDLGADDPMDSYDSNLSGSVASLYMRHGNFDTVTGTINDWNPSYSRSIPNSLYLPSAGASPPSWWPAGSTTYPYPWIDATSGTPLKTNSLGGSALPAKARYDSGKPFVQP